MGARLRLHANANLSKWDANALNQFWLATLEAGRGSYRRARGLLATAGRKIADSRIVAAFDRLLEDLETKRARAAEPGGPLIAPLPPESAFAPIDREHHFDIVMASLHRHWGEYDQAIAIYDRVRPYLPSEEHPQAWIAVTKARVQTRRYRANVEAANASDLIRAPAWYRRDGRAALAAVNLAWQLAQLGEGRAAIPMLEEARAYFERHDDDNLTPRLLDTRIIALAKDVEAYRDDEPHFAYYADGLSTRLDTANLTLDAVEYGKGDWDRSIHFVERLRRAMPGRGVEDVVRRLRELKAMAARHETRGR